MGSRLEWVKTTCCKQLLQSDSFMFCCGSAISLSFHSTQLSLWFWRGNRAPAVKRLIRCIDPGHLGTMGGLGAVGSTSGFKTQSPEDPPRGATPSSPPSLAVVEPGQ